MNNNDEFHQTVSVIIDLPRVYSPGESNRILKTAGANLNYDTYSFYRKEKAPAWQSETIIQLKLFLSGKLVDAQDPIDKIELEYPLATLDSKYIGQFGALVDEISNIFGDASTLCGNKVSGKDVIAHCDKLSSELMESWGEEPGSKHLRIMIESMYSG
ncbi:hypothetical protein KUV74_15630 [Halomonas sp. DP1Y21-3]|uniref:hypothetical protein n=1 Tax=Halomonas sp. DP1Y21-3 TaxID=2859080 RepID=UPI001C97FB4E|nr:hypothetical protein [Halomonas sp. DP1Y21-3]MBY6111824.1 hypothetical protein [Halomonas sp. DP1Y21-3]